MSLLAHRNILIWLGCQRLALTPFFHPNCVVKPGSDCHPILPVDVVDTGDLEVGRRVKKG